MSKAYTGIGSRETPEPVLRMFRDLGEILNTKYDLTLWSGHADGADIAFEQGCDRVYGAKDIFLPWAHFNGSDSKLIVKEGLAYEIAEKYHPYWNKLSQPAKKLQARNSHQLLGRDLNTPTEFILCWTKGGQNIGGTGQALRIAQDLSIPVINAGKYVNVNEFYTAALRLADSTL